MVDVACLYGKSYGLHEPYKTQRRCHPTSPKIFYLKISFMHLKNRIIKFSTKTKDQYESS
jgi:hypothetical protein